MSPPALQLKEIFAAALTIKDPAERAAYLAAACADAEVRVRIEGLLRASEDPVSFLDGGLELPRLDAEAPTRTFRTGSDRTDRPSGLPASEQAGAIVDGRYKLLERIGEGGMGTVWVAEQTHPIKRKVALKLIKAGMDSRSVLARFEAERQALALMDHPNIARVLDGGLTEGGRPYFAMEYVKGIPIAEYCDANRLSVPDRLQLFVEVCSAVQHAHQKGIIHRDLKPSNILVAPYDDRPVPKVIDFGLAKAMHQPLTEMTLHTAHETVLGTPLYMSPEQAQLNNLDVDTRSDIYSLGVLLYELLTGTTPLERKRFKEAAWDEIRRIIREEEPQRPSARLSSAATLPSLAASRRIEPIKLAKLLRGELDWIVMKALEKDRTRRYETANGLARDIQRYLSDEIVEARPPSSGYRIRKFVRRYKGRVLATSVLFLALLLGIAGTTFGLVRAEQQRRHAEEAASSETEARLIAQKAAELELLAKLDADEKRIEAEKQRARAVAGEQLASERYREVEAEKKKVEGEKKKADAERKRAEEEKLVALSVRDFLQNKLLGQADSRIQANSLLKIGKSPDEVKLNPTIRELLDRAAVELAPDRIEQNFANQPLLQAELLYTIGNTYRGVGEPNLSIAFLTRALELQQTHLGAEHLNAINTMGALATSYRAAGNTARSIELLEKVRDEKVKQLGAEHPSTLSTMNNLGMSYLANGKVALAIQHLEGIREADLKHWGPDHPIYINTLNNLGCAYAAGGNPAKAIEYFEIVYERRLPQYGLEHPYTLTTLHRLAGAYQATGKTDRAIEAFEKVRDVQVARLGPEHPSTLATYNNLALAYHFGGRLPEAIDVLERVREIAIRKWGEEHPSTLIATGNLAGAYQAVGKLPQAIEMFERVWRAQVAKRGINNPDTLTTRGNLASAYREAGDLDKALQHFEPVARGIEKLEFQHEYVSKLIPATIQAYEAAGEFEKAEGWRRKWLPIERQRDGANSAAHASELAAFALNLLHLQKYGEAEPLLRDCLRICEKLSGEKGVASWKVANVKSMLGEALLQQDKIVDAETFLHAGYEGLKRELRAIPDPLRSELMRDAIGRLAELASVEEKPAELEKWRAELAKYKPLAPMPRLVK